MSLVHAFSSVSGVCLGMVAAFSPKIFVGGAGPDADRKRSILRFCGAVLLGATAIEAAVALLARP